MNIDKAAIRNEFQRHDRDTGSSEVQVATLTKEIEALTLEGTRLLLLEMPFVPWTDQNLIEVERLIKERDLHLTIAHLERFLWIPGNKK